ncbi:MAG: efflux transporter outer membrane subunit [Caulobacteraceae bacterium]|nr:efflux transporter outer membrane subunit [Caulobacteraceae bacterium]
MLAACGGLAACAVGPDYRTPTVSTPAHWSGAADAPAKAPELSQWWLRLDDPTLNTLIDQAVRGNLDVAAAKARVREARASYRQARGALFPTLDASASVTRNDTGAGSASASGSNLVKAGFDASWEMDLFGANRRAAEAARYGQDAADEDLRSTLLTLIGDVAADYVDARGYQARIALARRTAVSQRQTAALTEAKFAAGSVSAADVASAAGLAASTEADIATLEAAYAEAVHQLSVLLGRDPEALSDLLATPAPPPAPPADVAMGVPADILLARPDVREAERKLAQYTAKIGQAQAARYPAVSLTGSIATSGGSLGDLAKQSSISWSYGPSVSLPIFEGGQLAAAVDVARAQRDEYDVAFRAAVLTALEDVENASVSLSRERVRNERLDASAKAYRQANALALSLYRAGSTSFLEALDAERSQYSAEDALIQSNVLIATDYIALNKALGGGWDGVVDASKPEVVDVDTGPRLARPH